MPISINYSCDNCQKKIELTYFSVERTDVKESVMTHDIFMIPQPKKIFCDMECLAKYHEWFLKRYNLKKD
jgi:hypothetical protein